MIFLCTNTENPVIWSSSQTSSQSGTFVVVNNETFINVELFKTCNFCNVWTVSVITVFQHNWHKSEDQGISEAVYNIQTVTLSIHFQLMFPLLRHYLGKQKRAVWGEVETNKACFSRSVPSLDTERIMPSLWSFQRWKAVSRQFTFHSMETECEAAAVTTTRNHHSFCMWGRTVAIRRRVLKGFITGGPAIWGLLAYFGPPFSTWSRINHIFSQDSELLHYYYILYFYLSSNNYQKNSFIPLPSLTAQLNSVPLNSLLAV